MQHEGEVVALIMLRQHLRKTLPFLSISEHWSGLAMRTKCVQCSMKRYKSFSDISAAGDSNSSIVKCCMMDHHRGHRKAVATPLGTVSIQELLFSEGARFQSLSLLTIPSAERFALNSKSEGKMRLRTGSPTVFGTSNCISLPDFHP